jgi:hypothetical protein
MTRAALTIPLRHTRVATEEQAASDDLARRGVMLTVLAWAVTYGGVLAGIAVLGEMRRNGLEVLVLLTFLLGAPVAGTALALSGVRKSMRSLQTIVLTVRTRLTSIAGLVVGLSFFIVPIAVVIAVSLWAFILPSGGA